MGPERAPITRANRNANTRENCFGRTLDKGRMLLVAESLGNIPSTRKPRWYAPTPAKFLLAVLVMQGVLFLSAHYRWFWFNERKGWTVLISVAATAIAMLLLVTIFAVRRFFKSKPQFTLSTLMLTVPVMAIPCAWMAREMERARQQKELVAWADGGYPYPTGVPKNWITKTLGPISSSMWHILDCQAIPLPTRTF